jgi:hypothetical protein
MTLQLFLRRRHDQSTPIDCVDRRALLGTCLVTIGLLPRYHIACPLVVYWLSL